MSGISAEQCKSICLGLIGGIPLMAGFKMMEEGSFISKQIGGFSLSSYGLDSFTSGLSGIDPSSILSNTFQNPISSNISDLGSTITTGVSDISGLSSSIGNDLVSTLNGHLSTLSSTNIDLGNLTNNISGVTIPDYSSANNFGLTSVYSAISSGDSLTSTIPSALGYDPTNISNLLDTHINNIVAPIQSGETLTTINSDISSGIDTLKTLANQYPGTQTLNPDGITYTVTPSQQVSDYANTLVASINDHNSTIAGISNSSRNSMNTLMSTSANLAPISLIGSGVTSGSEKLQNLMGNVVKPSVLTSIQSDIVKVASA